MPDAANSRGVGHRWCCCHRNVTCVIRRGRVAAGGDPAHCLWPRKRPRGRCCRLGAAASRTASGLRPGRPGPRADARPSVRGGGHAVLACSHAVPPTHPPGGTAAAAAEPARVVPPILLVSRRVLSPHDNDPKGRSPERPELFRGHSGDLPSGNGNSPRGPPGDIPASSLAKPPILARLILDSRSAVAYTCL